MHRFTVRLLALSVVTLALPLGAQQNATSTFSSYASPVTTEHQAAVGRPVTSGVLDFYATERFVAGARNVLGTWGSSPADPGFVNRPINLGTSTAMFGTQLGEEIDIFGTGSDIVLNRFVTFSMHSMDVAHLYSTAYSPAGLLPFTLSVLGFGPSTGNTTIQQIFSIAAPSVIAGVQTPVLQTLTFDNRWRAMSNVWWFQSNSSSTAHQFTNIDATLVPEPGTYALMFVGLMGVGAVRARRRRLQQQQQERHAESAR
jgi:hypothetical protein